MLTLTCLYQIASSHGKKQLFEAEVIYLMAKTFSAKINLCCFMPQSNLLPTHK